MPTQTEQNAIALAEVILNLLDEGSYTATYKYAVMLGLIDLCIERTDKGCLPPQMVTTRQLAEKILEIYWPHSLPFHVGGKKILRQNTKGQAKVLSDIECFRKNLNDPTSTLTAARISAKEQYETLVKKIERTLIVMPLPRLQVMGVKEIRFLYDIDWDRKSVDGMAKSITQYQKDHSGPFDNRIHFRPGVPENIVKLNGLLRPLLYRNWARMVADINSLDISKLEDFLFCTDRKALNQVRTPLREQQNNRCFYCNKRLGSKAEVDHFIPWARYPDNCIFNLVVSDEGCNGNKRHFLAYYEHLKKWIDRNAIGTSSFDDLNIIASRNNWENDHHKTESIARSLYHSLPDHAMLWVRGKEMTQVDNKLIRKIFDQGVL